MLYLVSPDLVVYSDPANSTSTWQPLVEFFVDSKPAPQNIQDAFLNLARREKATVTIYLVNGAKLLGRIKSFDKFSLILESGAQEQLIFKHAISTISQNRRGSGELRGQLAVQVAAGNSEQPEEPVAS